ncbi:MAG: hypothetical protein HQ477_11910 [Chloroflexi bacterium]|nr:hypothetical protein [Chloroflexota bacterium]
MKLIPVGIRGSYWEVLEIELDDGTRPAAEFMAELESEGHTGLTTLLTRLKTESHKAVWNDKRRIRKIENFENVWEVKTPSGVRMLFAKLEPDGMVLTSGFKKGDPPNSFFRRAESLHEEITDFFTGGSED